MKGDQRRQRIDFLKKDNAAKEVSIEGLNRQYEFFQQVLNAHATADGSVMLQKDFQDMYQI